MLPTTCSTVFRRLLACSAVWLACWARLPASVACWSASFALADAFLRPGIHVFDVPGVGGGEVVELIHPVTDRAKLALHVFLAREGIDLAPESLSHFRLERLPRRHVLIRAGTLARIGCRRRRGLRAAL